LTPQEIDTGNRPSEAYEEQDSGDWRDCGRSGDFCRVSPARPRSGAVLHRAGGDRRHQAGG